MTKKTKRVLGLLRLAAFTAAVAAAGFGSPVFADDPPDWCGLYKDVPCACGVAYCDSGGYSGPMFCRMIGCEFGADIDCGTPPNQDFRTFCRDCRPCGGG